MSDKLTNDNGWGCCPRGGVGQLVSGLRGKRRKRQSAVAAGIASAFVMLVVIGAVTLNQFRDGAGVAGPDKPLFACSDIELLAEDYIGGKLDAQTAAKVDRHIKKCKNCQAHIAELREQKAQNAAWRNNPLFVKRQSIAAL